MNDHYLDSVNERGLHFKRPAKTGGYLAPLPFGPIVVAPNSGTAWEAEISTLSWLTPGDPDGDGNATTVQMERVITAEEIQAGIDFLNTPAPLPVPEKVTPLQMDLALEARGLDLDALPDLITHPDPATQTAMRAGARKRINRATFFTRSSSFVAQIGTLLNYDAAAIDQVFREADAIDPAL